MLNRWRRVLAALSASIALTFIATDAFAQKLPQGMTINIPAFTVKKVNTAARIWS